MKVWKTERIIYFKPKIQKKSENKITFNTNKNISNSKPNLDPKFLSKKKLSLFKVENFAEYYPNEDKIANSGRWSLKEHIQFIQALDKYGVNWKIIRKMIRTRTATQIRSHCQKFFIKLKKCKDEELGIDFTLDHINNMNDILAHIKSVNKNFDVVNVLLYMSGKYCPNIDSKKLNEIDKAININNIFYNELKNDDDNNNELKYDKIFDENDDNKLSEEIKNNQQLINNGFDNNNNINNNNYFQNTNFLNYYLYKLINNYINNAMNLNLINNINNNVILGDNIQNLNQFYIFNANNKNTLDYNSPEYSIINNVNFKTSTNITNNTN